MVAVVKPAIREGLHSGIMTLVTICQGEQPMAWAASRTPWSISRRELSTTRATKGAAAMVRETMQAVVPMEVPTISRARGWHTTIKMVKGTDRSRFTMMFSARINPRGRGRIPPASPVTRMMPKGRPMR